MKVADDVNLRCPITGFLFELPNRGRSDRVILAAIIVADQAGGQLDAALSDRHPILLDQKHLALVGLGKNDRGADTA